VRIEEDIPLGVARLISGRMRQSGKTRESRFGVWDWQVASSMLTPRQPGRIVATPSVV